MSHSGTSTFSRSPRFVDLDQSLLAVIATRDTPSDNALLERSLQAHRLLNCRFPPSISYYTEASIGEHRMTNAKSELRVQVLDDEIIVTLPGSHYSVTYYKPAKSPQLLVKCISDRDDPHVAMRLSDFLARAWRLANDKARELGWGWGM